jgi:hypothetical protein
MSYQILGMRYRVSGIGIGVHIISYLLSMVVCYMQVLLYIFGYRYLIPDT